MGYTHDTASVQFIPTSAMIKTAGTWTDSMASNLVKSVRTAAAATFNVLVPIVIPSNGASFKGARLKSVDLLWLNATADLNSVTTVELEKMTLPVNGVAVSGAVAATTIDSANDTTAKRITQASHTMTVTVTNPVWSGAGDVYWLYVTFDAPATSVVTLFGSRAYFDYRV